ncbi:hypothetical protein, partial [Mesorhizobium sp. P5_C1]
TIRTMITPAEKRRRAAGNGGLSDVGTGEAPKMNAQCTIIVPLAAGENLLNGNWTVTSLVYSNGRTVSFAVKWRLGPESGPDQHASGAHFPEPAR